MNMFVRFYSTLVKKNKIVHFNLNLMITIFVISMKKESKYMANTLYKIFFASPFTVPPTTHVNPNFKMTLHNSHNAGLTVK